MTERGQYGSVVSGIRYRTEAHPWFATVQVFPTANLELFANTLWYRGEGTAFDIDLDPSNLPQEPPGMDYGLLSESFSDFSKLDVRRAGQASGVNYRFDDRLVLNVMAEYDDYDDSDPFLYSTDGRHFFVQTGVALIF